MSYSIVKSLDLEITSNQYAERTSSLSNFPAGSSSKTVEAWVKFESLPSSGDLVCLVDFGNNSDPSGNNGEFGLWIKNVSGLIVGFVDVYNRAVVGSVSLGFTIGVWYHYAVRYNGTSIQWIVDGIEVDSVSAGTINSNVAVLGIGLRRTVSTTSIFDGKISLVRVWKESRSDAQLSSNACSVLGTTANLCCEYTFNSVYTDNSGNSNTLSAVGSPVFASDLPAVCIPATAVLTTDATTDITETTATLNGSIDDVGEADPTARGFVIGTTSQADPGDVAPASSGYDDYTSESGTFGTGAFSAAVTGLVASMTYYVRAWAQNTAGYSYGNEITFATDATPPFRFTNIQGVVYDPADTQTIFAERLNDMLDRLDALEA